ncbi:hypothetical protein HZA97_09380 [Candidatus Woesearchaeota archaeon]|nr:hypothetical protein [Candidatus Woesearchaeota archaeon]
MKTIQSMTNFLYAGLLSLSISGCATMAVVPAMHEAKETVKEINEGLDKADGIATKFENATENVEQGLKGLDPFALKAMTTKLFEEMTKNKDLENKLSQLESTRPDIISINTKPTLYITSGDQDLFARVTLTKKNSPLNEPVFEAYVKTSTKEGNADNVEFDKIFLADINSTGKYEISVVLEPRGENKNVSYMIALLLSDNQGNVEVYRVRNGRTGDQQPSDMTMFITNQIQTQQSPEQYFSDIKDRVKACSNAIAGCDSEVKSINDELGRMSSVEERIRWKHVEKLKENRTRAEESRGHKQKDFESMRGELELFIGENPEFQDEYEKILQPYIQIGQNEKHRRDRIDTLLDRLPRREHVRPFNPELGTPMIPEKHSYYWRL